MKTSSNPIIILHGWGLCGSKYKELTGLLKKDSQRVYTPDLPGFGAEPIQSKSMSLDDYVLFLENFIKKNKILNPVLIGHSFGGRVAIKYAWKNPERVSKLILTGVPIIRNKSLVKRMGYFAAIVGGKVFQKFPLKTQDLLRKILYFTLGEWDYYKAGPRKQIFKNIISEDLVQYAKDLKIPVLLVWGKEDSLVPVSDLKKIGRFLRDSQAMVVADVGHKLPYEKPELFFKAIKPFIA